ncbi:MAG: endonuclease/exonuclease/phosphatase family protein, partial [Acidobacteriota bacterium]
MPSVRIATYNVHKCRGLDRRVRPDRIAEVLREIKADIVALQEVISADTASREHNQARYLAEELDLSYCLGENRRLSGGAYGNALLSRFPVRMARNYDITWRGREQRGCLRADIDLGLAEPLHVFNVHLGTAFIERRYQGQQLISGEILRNSDLSGQRIVLGDFNEWTRGLASRLLASELQSVDVRQHIGRARTYPWLLPLLHLD